MASGIAIHQRCWDEIPWLVNGRLAEGEQGTLRAHIETCAECREELQRQQTLHAYLHEPELPPMVAPASWNKLLARIDAQSQAPEVTRQAGASRPRRWLVAAVWLQGIVIAGLLGALLIPQNSGEYVTLTTASEPVARAAIRVVFAPATPLARVSELLREVGGEIVAGPSEAGVYTVAIASGDVGATVRALRQEAEVLFAEPSGIGGAPPR